MAAADNKTNIPDVVKRSCLKGVFSKDVQEFNTGLSITNEKYSTALKILQERYANKQVLTLKVL